MAKSLSHCGIGLILCLSLGACLGLNPTSEYENLAQYAEAVVCIGDQNSSIASGFFVDTTLIVTSAHVLQRSPLYLLIGEERHKLSTVVEDKTHDLAILQSDHLSAATWLALTTRPAILGEPVYVIGNPFGLGVTLSRGVVSAIPGATKTKKRILTDAAINAGNSGGPLIDPAGEVLGVVTQRSRIGNGIGFATPAPQIVRLIERARAQIADR